MERFYKTKKDYNNRITKNGMVCVCDDRRLFINRFSEGNISEISCFKCKHYQRWDYFCRAYPDGIPDEILNGYIAHTEVRSDQKGKTIFTKK